MQAIYISSNKFKVSEDKTSEFLAGRRVRALCGLEYKYSTVQSSTYSSPDTTITLEEDELTSNLSEVHYGIINIGEQGSFPNHSHDGNEGTGGGLSLLTLSDTPSVYDEGKYLRSTTSGVAFAFPDDRYYTESEVDTISGTLQADIDEKSNTEIFLTDGVPSGSVGELNAIAINQNIGTIYKKESEHMDDIEIFYPATSSDDGERRGTTIFDTNDAYTHLGSAYDLPIYQFFRFVNVTIPQGCTIDSAYVKFTAHANDTGTTVNVDIAFVDEDNPSAPATYSEFDALSLTSNIDWNNVGAWTDGVQYDTPELKTILQVIVDRNGFSSGNAVIVRVGDDGSTANRHREISMYDYLSGAEKAELHITWHTTVGIPTWTEKLSPDFLKLSDTPTTYAGLSGQYLKTTSSGIDFVEDLYTKSEVDTISGSLQTDIDTKADTEWFLTEGTPSNSIGVLNDVAINQETGNIYERELGGGSGGSGVFYPAVSGDDGGMDQTSFSTSSVWLSIGNRAGTACEQFFRFPNVTIPSGMLVTGAFIRLTAYQNNSGVVCNMKCYMNTHDNAVAPTNSTEFSALTLTTGSVWDGLSAWINGSSYDTPSITSEVQSVVDRAGWASGNAMMVVLKDNNSSTEAARFISSIDYLSGVEKAELHVTWESPPGETHWVKKLSPDFLKLSDTPTTYSGVDGKYLKTTSSGIDFVEDLYTKSEVDTISGTLQTNIDGKSDIAHTHDDRYYTETELNNGQLDNRYYTESEVNTISGSLQTSIDSMPVTLIDLLDTPTTYSGSVDKYLKTTSSGIIFSDINSEYWESVDVFLDENYSNDKGLPTQVERGLFKGYSIPIWSTPANQYEELVFRIRVPFRWNGVTNPTFMILVSISATEDIGDKFKFQMEWESKGVSNVIPDTTAEILTDEVTVTDGTAYYSYLASASLDATKLIAGDNLQFRVRRVTATDPQVSNEIIVWHWDSRWKMNKLGTVSE